MSVYYCSSILSLFSAILTPSLFSACFFFPATATFIAVLPIGFRIKVNKSRAREKPRDLKSCANPMVLDSLEGEDEDDVSDYRHLGGSDYDSEDDPYDEGDDIATSHSMKQSYRSVE
jgi:hypothetical protein